MRTANIGDVFLSFKARLLVIRNATGESTANQRVRHIERRLKSRPFRSEMKDAVAVVDDAFRSPVRPEDMQIISVDSLITYRIVAIGRWQSLARRSGRSIHFAVVIEEIANIEDVSLVENLCDLSECLVVVVDLQNGVQLFGLEAELLLHLIDAGSARPHAARIIQATENKSRKCRRCRATLALISGEIESLVTTYRAANISAELIHTQSI